jgi:glycosyltransferase involved in cell wall biosynthesis
MKHLLIIIPAFNEEQTVGSVIESLPNKLPGINHIDTLVVDDGSTDKTRSIAKNKKVAVVSHIQNRGLGAALETGFEYARIKQYEYIITFDADGQHRAVYISRILKPLLEGRADVVIGSRLLQTKGMPLVRRIINVLSNIVTYMLFNVWTTDSQSGLRGFTLETVSKIRIRSQKMEVSSEIFKEISRLRLRVLEVPIESVYTHYSLKKGQRISNAPNVFWKLLLQKFV